MPRLQVVVLDKLDYCSSLQNLVEFSGKNFKVSLQKNAPHWVSEILFSWMSHITEEVVGPDLVQLQ